MSAQANTFGDPAGTLGTLNGMFKEQYADKMKELIPDGVKLLNMIDFAGRERDLGNLYHQPIVLGLEHGLTYAGPDDDAFNLLPPVASQVKDAQVKGNPKVMRSLLGYTAMSRSAKGGSQAFMNASKYVVGNALRSFSKKLEIEMLYGQVGYATVASAAAAVITITTAEWAPGIWAGAENLPIEIRDAAGTTSRGNFSVVSVDLDARTVTLDASATAAGVIATDVVWAKGAYGNEFAGIHRILSISSGTLFNINVGTYNLFRGNIYSAAAAALSFVKLTSAAARAVEKGQEGKLLAVINVRAWANMMQDQAALRRYDPSYKPKKAENGMESLLFHSQNGEIEIVPSIYVKEGYAYLLSLDEWMRVGSSDVTFNMPGQGDQFLRQSENSAALEFRLFTDQALFCAAPGRNVLINNIVNS